MPQKHILVFRDASKTHFSVSRNLKINCAWPYGAMLSQDKHEKHIIKSILN